MIQMIYPKLHSESTEMQDFAPVTMCSIRRTVPFLPDLSYGIFSTKCSRQFSIFLLFIEKGLSTRKVRSLTKSVTVVLQTPVVMSVCHSTWTITRWGLWPQGSPFSFRVIPRSSQSAAPPYTSTINLVPARRGPRSSEYSWKGWKTRGS